MNDGMTNSILSSYSEKDKFKAKEDTDENKKMSKHEKLMYMIDNIDSITDQIDDIKVSKIDFINCLREQTRRKMWEMKELKDMFMGRIRKLKVAQDYEMKNQDRYCIYAAHDVFKVKA